MINFLNLQTPLWLTLVLVVFLLSLLIWLWRLSSHYNHLLGEAGQKSLIKTFTGLQKVLAQHEKKLLRQNRSLKDLEQNLQTSLQRVILHRFNPFQHTGGKQSFILAILDGRQNGILITSLHSRENTRFYVKSIKEGEGVDYPLSPEEEKLIRRKGV